MGWYESSRYAHLSPAGRGATVPRTLAHTRRPRATSPYPPRVGGRLVSRRRDAAAPAPARAARDTRRANAPPPLSLPARGSRTERARPAEDRRRGVRGACQRAHVGEEGREGGATRANERLRINHPPLPRRSGQAVAWRPSGPRRRAAYNSTPCAPQRVYFLVTAPGEDGASWCPASCVRVVQDGL
eukprot:scaffold3228_cov384-Prasinococcus_capsulatus_cf.AAC.1